MPSFDRTDNENCAITVDFKSDKKQKQIYDITIMRRTEFNKIMQMLRGNNKEYASTIDDNSQLNQGCRKRRLFEVY